MDKSSSPTPRHQSLFLLSMASLKLYLDALSQPCRAIMILLEANKVPYEACVVKVAEGQ